MDLYEALHQRRTIRDLQDKEIPMSIIYKILEAGLKAPSNDHMRSWEFVVITDPEEKAKVIQKIAKKISKKQAEQFIDAKSHSDIRQKTL